MSVNVLLLQIVNFLTSETPSQPRHLLLLARYQHSQQLPLLTDLLRLIYAGQLLHTRHPLHYPRLFQLLKAMLLSADLFFTLLLSSKMGPAILKNSSNPPIPKIFQQVVKPGNSFSRYSSGANKMSMQARNQAGKLLEWCSQSGYFQFYFHLLNKGQNNPKQHLHSFMLQVSSEEESPLNEEEREELKTQMLTECEKLDKKNYREEALQGVYSWLKHEVIKAFVQTKDSNASMAAKDVLSRVVQTHHDLTCAALVHAIDRSCSQAIPQSLSSLLSFIDELVISGNTMTALHAILILSPSIFIRILRKQIALPYESVSAHYKLWRQGMQKRQIDSKLLMCLDQWLPVIYQREPLSNENFQEAFQLYRGQLAKLYKESRIDRVRVILDEIEIKKIEEIYLQMEPFHSQLLALEESKSNLRDKPLASVKGTSKVAFSFNVSEASGKEEFHSLMQSLRSSKQDSKIIVQPPNQEQLKIYSKRHSIHNSHIESETSVTQDIEFILNLLQLLQEPPLSSSISIQQNSKSASFVQKTPFLPILSKHSKSNSEVLLLQKSEDDPYGIRQRGKVSTREVELKVIPLRAQTKRKILKSRGLICKNTWMQIGYLVDSQYKRRRLTLFVTFLRRIETASVVVKEKSVKLWKKGKLTFLQPKLREQYKSTLQIQKIKTYQIQGLDKSHRYMRPKLQLSAADVKGQTMAEVHEIPIYLYNLQEWLEIPNNEMYMFELEAELGSGWLPLNRKILKNKGEELGSYFPLLRVDPKGNVCLKFCLLHEVIFAKIYLVLEEVRVVLVNSSWELALMALLEMVVGE